jgi:DNA-binding NarL/FixJ family response regulator
VGATTPALRLAIRAPLLTTREHEVAVLATSGLTSKAIAERLVVSPRTVESHMYRIFAKLGVENRSQLAEVLDTEVP